VDRTTPAFTAMQIEEKNNNELEREEDLKPIPIER